MSSADILRERGLVIEQPLVTILAKKLVEGDQSGYSAAVDETVVLIVEATKRRIESQAQAGEAKRTT